MVCAFVLVDVRHEPQKIDMEFMEFLGENMIPFSIIFTKADKLKPKVIEKKVDSYIQELLEGVWEEAPNYFITSSSKNMGRDEVLYYIDDINQNFFQENK